MPAVASDPNPLPNAMSAPAGRPQRPQASAAGESDASSPFALMLEATAPAPDRAPRKAAPSEPSAPARPADTRAAAEPPPVRNSAEAADNDAAVGKEAAPDKGALTDTADTGSETTQDDPATALAPQQAEPPPAPAAAVAPPVMAATDPALPTEGEPAAATGAPALPAAANAAPAPGAEAKPQAGLMPDAKAAEAGTAQAAGSGPDLTADAAFGADDDPQMKTATAGASPGTANEPEKAQAEPAGTDAQPRPQKADAAQKPVATPVHADTPQPDPANPPQQPAHHAMFTTAAAQDANPARAMTSQMTAQMTAQTTVPVSGLAVEIATLAKAGNSRFEIRLDPQELGRIDVRLDVDKDGNVKSRLIIERADTYDLLRRDASTLERALQQAGLKTSDHGLEFTLRDQGAMQRDAREHSPRNAQQTIIPDADILPEQAASGYSRLIGAGGGIDIRI